jgi:hypothetical protein
LISLFRRDRNTANTPVFGSRPVAETFVPTLFRFVIVVGVLAALVWGGMIALVTFVEPQPREMTQTLPASKFAK